MSKLKQKGQGMVEFALILIPLLMLVLGIIEAARVFQAYLAVQHSAREAARYAVTGQPFDVDDPNSAPFAADPKTRAEAIKQIALDQALGLPIDFWPETPDEFDANINRPGFFGVDIWGFVSYEEPAIRDHPGQPGLPIQVRVVYNLIILDPLYRAIIPQVRVVGHTEMVNEGFQVGYSGAPPPAFPDTPTFPPPPTVEPTATPPHEYIALDNYVVLPGELLGIELIQHDADTDYEVYWIAPDLTETLIDVVTTDGSGYEMLTYTIPDVGGGTYTIVSREQGISSDFASVDLLVEGTPPTATHTPTPTQTGVPTDTPTPTSTPTGAYIALSQYTISPGDMLTVHLIQHDPDIQYQVYWIPPSGPEILIGSGTTTSEGELDLPYLVPDDAAFGTYTIASRLLGSSTNVASVTINVVAATPTPTVYNPPDLVITDITWAVPTIVPGTPITVAVQIQNNGGTTNALFDIDLYVDPEYEPLLGNPGLKKQWQQSLGAGETATLVFDVTFYGSETTHHLWAQVDTTDFVKDEVYEYNNISGPVDVTVTPLKECYLDDDLESGSAGWTATEDQDDGGHTAPFALVEPGSGYYSSSSHSWWVDNANDNLQTYLDSPSVTIPVTATELTLNFWHRVRTENNYDGGWLRYSIDGGSTWQDVTDDMILAGGYSGSCGSSCPSGNHRAWEGTLAGHEVVVALPEAQVAGQDVLIRWQFECDNSVAAGGTDGWWIDDPAVCAILSPTDPPAQPKPPGLKECARVVVNGKFQENQPEVPPWEYGYPTFAALWQGGGYPQPSNGQMRLNAVYLAGYGDLQPYLYQDLTMPDFITTTSTAELSLYKQPCNPSGSSPSGSTCIAAGTTDPLYVVLKDPTTGVTLTQDILVASGSDLNQWTLWSGDLFDPSTRLGGFEPLDYAGDPLQLYFYAPNDGTAYTWFFVDTVECEVCTAQPIPAKDPSSDRVTVGGLAQVLLSGVPRKLQGMDIHAYTADGELFYTYTIQDSTYHFYWVLPPNETIYIYAETYVGGYRYWTQTTVPPLSPGGERHDVDLLLLPG